MEARITRIEDGLSEWTATTRTRWEGLTALNHRMCDLYKNKGGMWHVKKELFELVFNDLDHALGSMEDIARQTQIRSELRGILILRKKSSLGSSRWVVTGDRTPRWTSASARL